jgi:hypothetical protein
MALQNFDFKAGIQKDGTEYSDRGSWSDGSLVRFRKQRVEKIGGWSARGTFIKTFLGSPRNIVSWAVIEGSEFLGVGTTFKYYIEQGGIYYDVTPIRRSSLAGEVTFSCVDGSSEITVTDTSQTADNGVVLNDFVTFSDAVTLGSSNITAAVLNQEYQVKRIVALTQFVIEAKDPTTLNPIVADATVSGGGGGQTVAEYQINVGLDTYISSTGFGAAPFGFFGWGNPVSLNAANQLRLWNSDNFGRNLYINPRLGGIYRWTEDGGINQATGEAVRAVELKELAGANLVPTIGLQVVVSDVARHLVVMGADPIVGGVRTGVIDPMLIAFSDAENDLDFEPLSTNAAGSVRISSGSIIIGAIKSRQEILVFTDTSVYSMSFIGPPLTFGVNLVSEGYGLIAPNAVANAPNGVYFATATAFYFYSGSVKEIPCSVQEYVFTDIDFREQYKCHMGINSEFGEMWFFYPSITDNTREISRYVIYNYEENNWSIGKMDRRGWMDSGLFNLPVAGAVRNDDQKEAVLYDHEDGYDADGEPMTDVFIQSADIDIAAGEQFAFVKKLIPDVEFFQDPRVASAPAINISLETRDFPSRLRVTSNQSQITPETPYKNWRGRSRQISLKFSSDDDNTEANQLGYKWRVGTTRLDIQPSGRRG